MLEQILALGIDRILLLSTASVALLACLMSLYNARVLLKQKRQQQAINKRLTQDMTALSRSAVGMGQKVMESERRLNEVLRKQFSILNSQPEHPSYDQASKLIAMGANEADLVNSCGFSHSEAELLLSLNRKRDAVSANAVH
ncbi:DUF2802 domain-containing protein [Bermanella marisrubri]|uniref:DUF2802 domain-containing protein n=1 Tax=Bermanella marisrubri TaxID=207949 RepID=Q1N2T4_9GAMM|nr:DUF2802 domain-containing protein [Bermanella marisrubri]EAT12585.1 hypothetical protein RED65_06808 [Oceanobacter sp. RED65] [Bermanella marisrubri]QIZ84860.1 DUF2802 domain-containing protein [Bermanella marisrubri]